MNHFKHQAIFTILFSFILLFSSDVLSSESSEEQALSQNILTTMNQLLFKLEQNKSKYKDDQALFYQELIDVLIVRTKGSPDTKLLGTLSDTATHDAIDTRNRQN